MPFGIRSLCCGVETRGYESVPGSCCFGAAVRVRRRPVSRSESIECGKCFSDDETMWPSRSGVVHYWSFAERLLSLARRRVADEARPRADPCNDAVVVEEEREQRTRDSEAMTRKSNKYLHLPTKYRKLRTETRNRREKNEKKEIFLCFLFSSFFVFF